MAIRGRLHPAELIHQVAVKLAGTVGTEAMCESGVGSLGDVFFDYLPLVVGISDLIAGAADGEEAFERFDFAQRTFQTAKVNSQQNEEDNRRGRRNASDD